jgi:multisubunit Na+/H+ antiporter MnhF subunit
MSEVTMIVLQFALVVMILLLVPLVVRVFIGPSPADRLQAIETMITVLLGVILLLSSLQQSIYVIDVAIALAAFGFVATLAIARFLSEGRVF